MIIVTLFTHIVSSVSKPLKSRLNHYVTMRVNCVMMIVIHTFVLEKRDKRRKQSGTLKAKWSILSACHADLLGDHPTPVGSVDL